MACDFSHLVDGQEHFAFVVELQDPDVVEVVYWREFCREKRERESLFRCREFYGKSVALNPLLGYKSP